MRYSKQNMSMLHFAKWCIREKQNPSDILDLCKMAERIYSLAVKDANGGEVGSRMVSACERMRAKVKEVFGESSDIHWPGFWPVIEQFQHGQGIVELRLPTLN